MLLPSFPWARNIAPGCLSQPKFKKGYRRNNAEVTLRWGGVETLIVTLMNIFQVGNSVSVSRGYRGGTASVSVAVNQFEESEETEKDFGEQQLNYTTGGDDLPEPIRLKLMSIEETLKPNFLEELKKKSPCKSMSLTKLGKFLKNTRKTIKDYPSKLGAKRATGIYTITKFMTFFIECTSVPFIECTSIECTSVHPYIIHDV